MVPVHQCPEDVLLMVFYSVVGKDSKLAMVLLLVCRRWYDIVVGAPRLWNHIDVKLGRESRILTYSDVFKQFIMTCLQRSASLGLHIRLNLEDLQTRQRKPFKHPKGTMEAISVLVGENGEHMKRWETVHITFPRYLAESYRRNRVYDDPYTINEPIWRLFSYPAPNLTKLLIWNARFNLRNLHRREHFTTFLQLESLTELRINGNAPKWDFLGLNFESVTELLLGSNTGSHRHALAVSQFTHLRHLMIYCNRTLDSPSTPATFRLPSLQTLSMRCYSPPTTTWDIPTLQMLTFLGYRDSLDSVVLPTVQASRVFWRSYEPHQKDPVQIQHHLRLLLSQYTEMRKLTIPSVARAIWEGDALTSQRGSRIVEVEFIE